MSAIVLCGLVLWTQVTTAFVVRNGFQDMSTVESETSSLNGTGFFVYNPNRRIVVEEVDRHGNSVVKELELPDYDEGEELRVERKRPEQWEGKQRSEKSTDSRRQDLYGCDYGRDSQRRKCLQRQKKFLKSRYRNWKTLIRRIIKDLDGKIKTMGHATRRESTTANLNFMSGFSPKNVMRKKE